MIIFPFISGLVTSGVHVLSGADHLAAVTPMVVEAQKRAWKVGLFWGLGHLAGMLLIGLLVYFFRELIPFEAISAYSEQLVGVILVLLALWIWQKLIRKDRKHIHPHYHLDAEEPYIHTHQHQHTQRRSHAHQHTKQERGLPFGIGLVHGIAGVSHLILLLPILSFETSAGALIYLLGFSLGSVLAMVSYAFLIGIILKKIDDQHHHKMTKIIRIIAGLFALIIGLSWLFK